jgi:hypothetical protein
LKISVKNDGQISSIIDNTFPASLVVKNDEINVNHKDINSIYFYNGKNLIYAKKEIKNQKLIITSKQYESILYNKNLILYFKDTTATGTVFMPDPLTSAGVNYGGSFIDNEDNTNTFLNNQLDTVVLDLLYDELKDTFYLENDVVKITDHSFPFITPVTKSTDTFYYTRDQNGFEDVNAFYHITAYNKYLKSLGFNNLVNYQIHVDTHGMGGADQSGFMSTFSPPRLSFGEGGVDDAEDADVIIHEYTHAIMYDATGQAPNGVERSALDEANGDILASSYSRNISEHKWDEVFTWDGHNEFWDGRLTSGNKHYPEDKVDGIYADTDIWSAAIMEIWGKIGREATDKSLIESMYGYSTGMTMQDAAKLFIETDTILHGSINTWDICLTFLDRGLLNQCFTGITEQTKLTEPISLWNTTSFSNNTGNAYLYSIDSAEITLSFHDLGGKLLRTESYTSMDRIAISPMQFAAGVYILHVTSGNKEKSFKLVKH